MTAPGTDIKLGIAGRNFIPCDGDHNMPDGEFFTGPVEDSVEGEVSFHLPAVIGGREVSGVRLRFEAGRVVDASAERGEEYLIKLLDTDEGARTPRRARDRHQLRRSTAAPARSCSTRRSAAPSTWRSAPAIPSPAAQRVRRPHRPRLRPPPRRQARSRRRGDAGRRPLRRLSGWPVQRRAR